MQWEILGVSGAGGHFSERKGQFRSVQGNSGSARGISGSTQPLEAYRKFPGARREFQGAYDTGNSRSTQKILEPKGSWGERGLGSHGEVTQCYLFFGRLGPHLAPPTSTRLTRPSSRPECRSSSPHAPRLLQITIRFKKQTWKPLSLSLCRFFFLFPPSKRLSPSCRTWVSLTQFPFVPSQGCSRAPTVPFPSRVSTVYPCSCTCGQKWLPPQKAFQNHKKSKNDTHTHRRRKDTRGSGSFAFFFLFSFFGQFPLSLSVSWISWCGAVVQASLPNLHSSRATTSVQTE